MIVQILIYSHILLLRFTSKLYYVLLSRLYFATYWRYKYYISMSYAHFAYSLNSPFTGKISFVNSVIGYTTLLCMQLRDLIRHLCLKVD